MDAASLAATDGFMRAVWVDHDCSAAERFMGSPATDSADWCRSERTAWTRRNFFLVQHSRHVVGDRRPSQLFDVDAASPECIQYKLVGRTAAGCRYPDAGCSAIMRDWEQRVPLHSRGPV